MCPVTQRQERKGEYITLHTKERKGLYLVVKTQKHLHKTKVPKLVTTVLQTVLGSSKKWQPQFDATHNWTDCSGRDLNIQSECSLDIAKEVTLLARPVHTLPA